MSTKTVDLHPDDTHNRVAIVAMLARARRLTRQPLRVFADTLGITSGAIGHVELHPDPDPFLGTVQRYARGAAHRLTLTNRGLPEPGTTAELDMYAILAGSSDPVRADEGEAAYQLAHAVAVRREHVNRSDLAQLLDISMSGLKQLECGGTPARIGTRQRYVRAVGMLLGLDAHLQLRLERVIS